MEGRIARLESTVAHIQSDVEGMKVEQRRLSDKVGSRDRIESGVAEICQSIAQLSVKIERAYGKSKAETIATKVWALSTLGGILLIIARTFKWI